MMTEYGYEIWFDGQCLTESYDMTYETEDEAYDEGKAEALDRIEEWKSEGCYDGETLDDFDIRITEKEV